MSSEKECAANFKPSYTGIRDDVLNLVPGDALRVLDIGCGTGALGERVKRRNNAEVVGVEIDRRMASVAEGKLDRVIVCDVEGEDFKDGLESSYFDCIIMADVLEHLRNPWDVLKSVAPFLKTGGSVIASIPNVRHYTTIGSLVIGGRWPYRERGIHDKAHLRFFTLRNIREMFECADLTIVGIRRKYRIIERFHPLNRYSKLFAIPLVRDFFTFQYLIVAEKGVGEHEGNKQ